MGNTASVGPSAAGALDSYVSELGDGVVYDKSLGYTRLLKSVKAKHTNGPVVIKFFIKPDPSVLLRGHYKRLKAERDALLDIPNVHSYQVFTETEKAGYLVRQWLTSSLYDRISIRPFLMTIEKKWIAFQILQGLRDARNRGVSHGDIKSSNILVTSWNWVYITDFATTYKPTYLPLNDPADFSFYFDTSGRRTCYVAPERFYDANQRERERGETKDKRKEHPVLESMDVFSAGCVLTELWLDGETIFTLSSMFKYRSGESVLEPYFDRIADSGIKELLRSMTVLDPSHRPSFDSLLQSFRGSIFPEAFYSFLHNYISSVNEVSSPSPFAQLPHRVHQHKLSALPSDSNRRLDRLWNEFDSVESYLFLLTDECVSGDTVSETPIIQHGVRPINGVPYQDLLPVVLHLANREPQVHGSSHIYPIPDSQRRSQHDSPLLIFLSLVLANMRNATLPSAKLHGMDLLLALSAHMMDQTKLDRILPFLMDMLHDGEAIVRLSAMRTVVQLTMQISSVNPSDSLIWPEYILPNMRHLTSDPATSVRSAFAQLISPMAEIAVRFLEMSQVLKMHANQSGARAVDYELQGAEGSYQAHLNDIQIAIQELLSSLLADTSSSVKRATLHNVSSLCIFLGRQKANELLLSHMITYLNDRDWQLRYAFFESVVDVAACLGGRSVEQFILPLLYQALSDSEENVVSKVLSSLRNLAELGLFPRMRAWELMSATLALLYHPNIWIRQGASAFIVSSTKHLPSSDTWAILYPSLKHYLLADVSEMKENQLLDALKPCIPRQVFDAAINWASKSDGSLFWKSRSRARSPESPKEALAIQRKTAPGSTVTKNEGDEQQLSRLKQLGMSQADEAKLLSMREYIFKHASAILSSYSRVKSEIGGELLESTSTLELQKLGVVPRTVFLGSRDGGSRGRALKLSDVLSPRPPNSRRASFSSTSPRVASSEKDGNQLAEELRRQLAAMGTASTASTNRVPRPMTNPVLAETLNSSNHLSAQPTSDSLTETSSIVEKEHKAVVHTPIISRPSSSMSSRAFIRPPHGLGDAQKALPAVASIRENVSGMLEQSVNLRPKAPTITISSGRSSPASNANTVRPEQNMLHSSQAATPQGLLDNLIQHDLSLDASQDFGPSVRDIPLKRRNNVRQTFSRRQQNESRDGCQLIATLSGHSGLVTGIAVSPDHCFFVTASSDKSIKVWDAARLERNITSKARQTYTQHKARITAVCMLEKLHCFASAADNGSIHIVRVPVTQSGSTPKYGKLQSVREHQLTCPGEYATCLSHFQIEGNSNLVFATTHGNVSILELNSNEIKKSMCQPVHLGPITSLCIDQKHSWLITGTLKGFLSLWDIRFGVLIRSWKVSLPGGKISHCAVDPTRGQGSWVLVALSGERKGAALSHEFAIEVWDVERTNLVETFTSCPGEDLQSSKSKSMSVSSETQVNRPIAKGGAAEAIDHLLQTQQKERTQTSNQSMTLESPFLHLENDPSVFTHTISCFLAGVNFYGPGYIAGTEGLEIYIGADDFAMPSVTQDTGFLLTGSRDCRVRFWDINRIEKSRVICGVGVEDEKPVFLCQSQPNGHKVYYETWNHRHPEKRMPPRSNLLASHQQELLKAHQDTIVAIACIQYPFRGGIITGDASGGLKVWRVETT